MTPIDYSQPIGAVDVASGQAMPVTVDKSYATGPDDSPVRLPFNLWAKGGPAGTWHFDRHGLSVGGQAQSGGNEGRFVIRNI